MRLAEYTDYTLRVLMYCAERRAERVTIGALAEHYGLSKNHLMKVVNELARQGLLETTRGRGGGLRLAKDPAEIGIGAVVRASETDFRLVECFDAQRNQCTLTPNCRLRTLLDRALRAWFDALDGATLADIVGPGGGGGKAGLGPSRPGPWKETRLHAEPPAPSAHARQRGLPRRP
jgi:Rrf2 family nitric oxide-sensitive transcriptional repressor